LCLLQLNTTVGDLFILFPARLLGPGRERHGERERFRERAREREREREERATEKREREWPSHVAKQKTAWSRERLYVPSCNHSNSSPRTTQSTDTESVVKQATDTESDERSRAQPQVP
jgi:hypothetical protein